ncbi:hypothetical protein FKV24_005655 [Lysobacter maris]|uniref:Uncharacterized protein n=1 Tax=Marilutibacter maris TaxID=1605891 RepID=A0A508AWB2_9GAMM|nr:hypothetical protein [Lysobacter maris]KAB8194973.1 hypothetical protein FKV24_005655 [Lysobacter maris]
MRLIRILAVVAVLATGVLAALPGIAYTVALARVDGRPQPADPDRYSAAALETAWRQCSEWMPLATHRLDPWTLVLDRLDGTVASRAGELAAWQVARAHNSKGGNRGNLWWHSSGAALTIWISRHWSARQIAATVARDGLCG